jgi:hypothetical protein
MGGSRCYDRDMAMRRTKVGSNLRLFDFGEAVPFTASNRAAEMVTSLNPAALSPVLSALRSWVGAAPVKAARAVVYQDIEDEEWREVVLEFLVEADEIDPNSSSGSALWNGLESAVKHAEEHLSPADVEALNKDLAIYIASKEDWKTTWGDDSGSAI